MGRARPKVSPTDQHARRIAVAIVKGRPPALTPDLDLYLESSPHEIFAAFEGAVRHMPPAGKDEAFAFGYLFLLQGLLEHLRYRTDRGYADAAGLIADFQAEIAAQAEAGHIDGRMLAYIAGALHQSKIPASPELAAVSARQHVNDDEGGPLPADVRVTLAGFLEACGGDPFVLVGSLVEFGHAMPGEARGVLAGSLALAGTSDARGAAILFLLDPDPVVRRAVAGALAQVASSLSPTEVRRLIAMRNWRPENERAEVDTVIRKARAAGIDCAQWEAGSVETILTLPCLPCPGLISTAWCRITWRSVPRKAKHRRSACCRSPRRSAAPTGNPRAWTSVKRSPGLSQRSPKRCVAPRLSRRCCEKAANWPTLRSSRGPGSRTARRLRRWWQAHAAPIERSLPSIFYRASLHSVVTNGPTCFCGRPCGCARRPPRPICAGASSPSSPRRSPTGGT